MPDDLDGIWDRFSEPERDLFDDALENIADYYGDRGISDSRADSLVNQIADDNWVAFLYHEAMWDFEIRADFRQGAYDAFVDYMEENYGIVWDEVYDWEDYRAAYDNA